MSGIKYPQITVSLVGSDGNAIAIMTKVKRALARAGVPSAEQAKFQKEALSGDYDHVLDTALDWVNVD